MNIEKRKKGHISDIVRKRPKRGHRGIPDLIFAKITFKEDGKLKVIDIHHSECSKNLKSKIRLNTVVSFTTGSWEGRNDLVGVNAKFVDQIQTGVVKDSCVSKNTAKLRVLNDGDIVSALLVEAQYTIDDLLEAPECAEYTTNVLGTTDDGSLVILLEPETSDIFSTKDPLLSSSGKEEVTPTPETDTDEATDEDLANHQNVPASNIMKLDHVTTGDNNTNIVSQ